MSFPVVTRSLTRALFAGLAVLAPLAPATVRAQEAPGGTLVVLNKAENTASLIDVASGRTLAKLPTGVGPHEVAMSSGGTRAAVANYGAQRGGRTLTIIDVARGSVERTIDLGSYGRPHGIAFLPGDSLLAVTSEASRNVVLVRVADGTVVGAVSTERPGSHMLAPIGDATRIYTSNIPDHSVSELDMGSGRMSRIFEVPPQPEAIGVTRDGREVWVGSNARGVVSVIDTETGEVSEAAKGFGFPYRILFTPDERLVIVPDFRGNELRFIDRATRTDVASLPLPSAGPMGLTLSADGRTLFLSLGLENRVAVIDLATREILRTLEAGARPDGVGYSELVLAEGP
ncbi:MAG: YncE family protein [Gemmatimonadota bacterium]